MKGNDDMKKTVIVFSREYPPTIVGGTAIVARSCAEGLNHLGYKTIVVTSTNFKVPQVENRNGIIIIGIPGRTYEDHSGFDTDNLRYHKKVVTYLKNSLDEKPDIVLVPDLFSFPEAYLYSKINKIPLVNILLQDFIKMTVYDKRSVHSVTNNANGTIEDLLRIEEKSLRCSSANVFISNALANSIKHHYLLDDDNCHVIYLGIDPIEMKKSIDINYSSIRDKICPSNKILLMSTGRLVPVKGFDILIKSFAHINKLRKDLFLCILGTGPEEEYLRKLIHDYQLENDVRLLYISDRAETVSYMQTCDIAVVPSLWESFCYVAAEFMAMKKPIVVSGVDSLNELVEHDKSGLICPVNIDGNKRIINEEEIVKALSILLDEKEYAANLAENAYQRAHSLFTRQNFAKNISALIEQLTVDL